MYLTQTKKKSVIVERFIRVLENKIDKYMTLTSRNVYIDKVEHIVNKYNNTYSTITKMKRVDVKPNDVKTYALTVVKDCIIMILNLKLRICYNIKT